MGRARKRGARRPRETSAPAEKRLLDLARRITAVEAAAGGPPTHALVAGLETLVAAYAPDGPLARELDAAWLRGRREKSAALALAWAREQLRLALQELLERAARAAPASTPFRPEARAWLVLAACEAIAREPAAAAPERLRILLELSGHSEARC